MPRPRQPEVRKRDILDAAERLFVTRGFDQTSVQQILDATGLAKGTFYHHFASKEALMAAILDREVEGIRDRCLGVLESPGLSSPQRLMAVVATGQARSASQQDMLAELHRPQNIRFHHEALEKTMHAVLPILTQVVLDGIADGDFRTDYPEEALEMLLRYSDAAFDELAIVADAALERRRHAFVHHAELLLGAAPASFDFLLELLSQAEKEARP
ncbi:MAG: TetR/AcrR family transcriptional regulator [Tetrasphaera sp.]